MSKGFSQRLLLPPLRIINSLALLNQTLPSIKTTFTRDLIPSKNGATVRFPQEPTKYRKAHAPDTRKTHSSGLDSEVCLKPLIKGAHQKTLQSVCIQHLFP
ncbi:hypothetical protein V6N11_004603 [Hibiscus sabdariffa]|uniref:Uncharacterized protein n=1 Tax=Hibiscus sabdariffa TaxID=183260 RepID=A0ABR2SHF5_9ROSI